MVKDVEFFRQEYKKQKKLETFVLSRRLNRPNVKKWQVAITLAILPFLLFLCIFFALQTQQNALIKTIITTVSILLIVETYVRFCLILVVKCYQRYAKDETRKKCKCIPSCSEYAILSLKRIFPLTIALLRIRKRLFVTCNGEEYKIDFPLKKWSKDFESKL